MPCAHSKAPSQGKGGRLRVETIRPVTFRRVLMCPCRTCRTCRTCVRVARVVDSEGPVREYATFNIYTTRAQKGGVTFNNVLMS